MTVRAAAPRLRRVAGGMAEGMVIKPLLLDYLMARRFPGKWQVTFRQEAGRAPDGQFHPSSAPLMGDRLLYLYLTQPGSWEMQEIDHVSAISMFMGSALGDFIRMALEDMKLVIPPRGTCVACGLSQPRECREHGVIDRELGSGGHMDGLREDEVFELKSAAPLNLDKAPDMDVAYFREKWPRYNGQINEYMRMSGYPNTRVLFFGIGNPWPLREYLIPYDEELGEATAAKYRRIRLAVARGEMPQPCCAPGSGEARSCPAAACPVRRLTLGARP